MPSSAVFDKWKHGKLHSGSKKGPVVKSHKQAIAIYLGEKRAEAKHGGKYPEKRQAGGPVSSFNLPQPPNPMMGAPGSPSMGTMTPMAGVAAGMNNAMGPMGVAPGQMPPQAIQQMNNYNPQALQMLASRGFGVGGAGAGAGAPGYTPSQMPGAPNLSPQAMQQMLASRGLGVNAPGYADGGVAVNPYPSSAEEANAQHWRPKDPNNLTDADRTIILSPAYNPTGWTASPQDKINSANSPLGPMRALGGVAQPGVGNFNMGKQANINPSPTAKSETRNVMHGPVMSAVSGRTDAHKTAVPSGSYVIPADVVSGRGQGNTLAGMNILQRMFKMGPYGSGAGSLKPGRTMPGAMRPPKMQSIMGARGGGKQSGHIGKPTPVHLAGGELVVPPENLMQTVHPNLKTAHEIMDKWILKERKKHIKTLGKLPGPVKE